MERSMRLCKTCAETERKESGWRQDGPGLYSMAMPRMSTCLNCKTQAHGYKLCAGCAVDNGDCQGCFAPMKTSDALRSEVIGHWQTLTAARTAARALYEQTIEPFKDDVAKFEAAIAASEAQRNADCEPFWEAVRLANEKLNSLNNYAPDTERSAASTAYFEANRASEQNSSKAFENERVRNSALRNEFAQYKTYYDAARLLNRTEERASATYTAAVDRSIAIADAEVARQTAVEKAEASYQRALEFQDTLDRLLSI